MSSPSKRRRTSHTDFVDVDGAGSSRSRTAPGTANALKRASYLSPTKASLARGYPDILRSTTEAKGRRESEIGRRQSLRDLVLGTHPNEGLQIAAEGTDLNEQADTDGRLGGISQSSHPTGLLEETSLSTIQSPFLHRQAVTRENAIIDHFDAVSSPAIVPRLVPRLGTPQPDRHAAEVDLPPTPTEAGRNVAPERPRGLAGSSSPGGVGRRRVRLRGVATTTSPLKPKALPPVIDEVDSVRSSTGDVELASGLGDEESDEDITDHNQVDEETAKLISQKEEALRDLQRKLEALRHECDRLEQVSTTLSSTAQLNNQVLSAVHLQLLLDDAAYLKTTAPSSLEAHDDFKKDPAAWLNLFAPSNVRTSFYTYTKRSRGRDLLVHQTTLAAPPPWSLDVLNVSFETMIDIGDGKVDSIKFLGASAKSTVCKKDALSAWISTRLDDEVTRRDLSSIVTGVGRYFEESVRRATVWQRLTQRHQNTTHRPSMATTLTNNDPSSSHGQGLQSPAITTESQAIELLPYLLQPHLTIPLSTSASQPQKELMLTYTITLDWIGAIHPKTDICGLGIPEKAMASAKDLFRQLVREQDLFSAFDAVWNILAKNEEVVDDSVVMENGESHRKRMTRRVSDFD